MNCGLGSERQGQWPAAGLYCGPRLHIGFKSSPAQGYTVRNIEHLVGARRMSETGNLAPQIVRKIVSFERRKAILKADVHKESGRD